ncbi:sulfurtransferase [Desmospora profundinema]|uniref:Thiosulfate/3-mercaptopyruvate sulfurtransferase n=1 Tax=Desmospora profundinema TaxID=1571184 RepID=A0ABU1IMV1_9BACL|nr:sulfurtransferase [Desmospora profundinema]MDR6226108.1 thiosulfate/3-mercaptopyruvate sulfurtransferase [Desmospora profundinema]
MKPLMDRETLRGHHDDPDWVVVDCRFDLADQEAGRQAYEQGHIPGARYMDLERDLSGPVGKHGGRHPFPDLDRFVEKLGAAGIDDTKTVVAYDDQGGAMAARLWWMLRYLGHERAAVLNGGFQGWKKAGHPVTQEKPEPTPTRFHPRIRQPERLVGMEETKAEKGWVIDSRERERYEGKREPIDAKAGHIPGAVHYFWKDNLEEGQRWKSAEVIRERFSDLPKDSRPIVYCGSGVTACANLLALHLAGFENARLYAGSWSDWISYEENPIRQGPELQK